MTLTTPLTDTLDSLRPEPLFEWTYAIIVVNLAVQFYRFIAQFAILFFDIFKLSYGVDLFWPLTTDDLKPFSHYFTTQNEILYKLVECLILTIAAFFATLCLLDNIIIGLVLSFFVFLIHGLLAIFGFICVGGEYHNNY